MKKKIIPRIFFPGWSGWFKATYVKNSKWFESFHGRKRTFVRRINQVRIGIFWIFLIFTNFFPPNFLRIYFKSSRILCPSRQQALYTELKKMRGRGEEMDMLQELEQVKNRLYDRMGCPKFLLYFFFLWQFRIQERLKSTSYLWNTNLEINLCKLSPWRKKKFDYWEKWPNWKLPETEM